MSGPMTPNVEELLAQCEIVVTDETARQWGRLTPTNCAVVVLTVVTDGHRDEVSLKINGKTHAL